LTGYLVPKGWQENSAGPEPGWLTCPTAQTCYVEGDNATSPSGPSDMNSFYVSSDGAQTWSVLPVPAGVTFTSALSCASVTDCAAGGLSDGHQPVYLSTANGGHSWTMRPLPADVGQIMKVTCVTASTCRGLASPDGQSLAIGFRGLLSALRFFVTSDGGQTFTVTPFPRSIAIQNVACPTASHCVATGLHSHIGPGQSVDLEHGVLLTSDDGGRSWQHRAWPKGYGPGPVPELTCADASHCAMTGFVHHGQYTVTGFSADGGLTWTTSRFPRSFHYPMMNALACPTATTCYEAGGGGGARKIGNEIIGSAVVATTRDDGRSWQEVTLPAPAQVPAGMHGDSFMTVSQIDCPRADACIAIGTSEQGSTSTPIYTSNG
jgi:photosystem II stability/assembly factor-like uncharacterized protein